MASREVPRLGEKLTWLMANVPGSHGRLHTDESLATTITRRGEKLSATYVSYIRRGMKRNPSSSVLHELAVEYGVTMDYWWDDELRDRVNDQLATLAALKDSQVSGLLQRAHGVSPANLEHLTGILDQIRQLEGLDGPAEKSKE